MKLAAFKRVKHHQMPGDVCKASKIAMREGRGYRTRSGELVKGKSFCDKVKRRTRAVNKRRATTEILEG